MVRLACPEQNRGALLTHHYVTFSHFNIIRYCKRPFETAEEMNETIIRRHNERVKPDDTVFFLGDLIFKGGKEGGVEKYRQFEERLNGKFIFIKGKQFMQNLMSSKGIDRNGPESRVIEQVKTILVLEIS